MELGFPLAQLIETTEARNVAAWAGEHLEIGGGLACYAGPSSPISHAIGVGMNGPVTESDLDRLEDFYRQRGIAANLDFCPLADPTLMDRLGRRPYRITEFNNVLAADVHTHDWPDGVRIVGAEDQERWNRTMVAGFFERDDLTEEELAIGRGVFKIPGAAAFLAERDGVAVAAATACVSGSAVFLFSDSTLPGHRRLGLQQALIRARLNWAATQGCTLAFVSTLPGSGSQSNYRRYGFTVVYTKMNMCRDL